MRLKQVEQIEISLKSEVMRIKVNEENDDFIEKGAVASIPKAGILLNSQAESCTVHYGSDTEIEISRQILHEYVLHVRCNPRSWPVHSRFVGLVTWTALVIGKQS